MLFVPLTYTLATEEAERIGVDHVARMASSNDNTSNSYGRQFPFSSQKFFNIDLSYFSCRTFDCSRRCN